MAAPATTSDPWWMRTCTRLAATAALVRRMIDALAAEALAGTLPQAAE